MTVFLCSDCESPEPCLIEIRASSEIMIGSEWEEQWNLQNMQQNTDPWIINIYIYFKQGRIGFWGWPFSVIYALQLLIVTSQQPERQTVNTFAVNLLMETWKKACEGQSLADGCEQLCSS